MGAPNAAGPIARDSLMSLEAYARERKTFRAKVIAHKKARTVHVGPHVTFVFEDELTIRYQIQEMLRIERIFEEAGIEDELAAYNPLVPDGTNWKATMMIEYEDVDERHRALVLLRDIEDRVWIEVGDHARVHGIADEDLDRGNEEKTSAVHFVRFELTHAMIDDVKNGADVTLGIDHPAYAASVRLSEGTRAALARDLRG